mmetsp:Transcript_25620/g.43776  ORF Transcript_25620/g.43776 Transcript_25620/m.43776 type:complete len:89 (+) Transcript_25620:1-267(+)
MHALLKLLRAPDTSEPTDNVYLADGLGTWAHQEWVSFTLLNFPRAGDRVTKGVLRFFVETGGLGNFADIGAVEAAMRAKGMIAESPRE